MVSRDIIQRLLAIINDTRARLNTLESREVALLTATQTLTNKTLTTPTIGNFTNAQHAHTGATSGGTISHGSLTDLTTGDPHTQYLLESTYDANTILKADANDTPIALTVGASTIVGRAATGDIAALTAAQVATIVQGSIDHSQLTNLTMGDPHTQYLLESTYDANTILKADANDTPIALTVDASTIVGRASTGNIAALTAAQVATIVQSSIDHGSIAGLTDDDHTGYARLAGRSGGQTLIGGTAANDDLTLEGTSNATRTTSYVVLQPNGGNVGIGTTSPDQLLHIIGEQIKLVHTSATNTVVFGAVSGFGGTTYDTTGSSNTNLNIRGGLVRVLQNSFRVTDSNTANYIELSHTGGSTGYGLVSATNNLVLSPAGNVGIGTTSPSRKLHVAGTILIDGDEGGIAGTIGLTDGFDLAARSTGVGRIMFNDATNRDSSGFVKIYIGVTEYYIPVFAAI